MTTTNVCPQCGKSLPSDGPQGLCPACLLKAALPGQSALESAETLIPDSTPAAALDAGTHLKYFGDYELLEEIARGGMGVVWKARQTSLKRDVALKMIRAGGLASPEEVERFLREAEAAANLQHPNIVAIHEVGEHDGQHYFSMDYVAGRDLGALVKDGPLPAQQAARYVKIIAEAIHFAHQRGTLHRDLKPQNVLIDGADQPRITDFGLAKIMKEDSRLTQPGVIMGSPSYMPPEQAGGRHGEVSPASDVYSLGAILYELLTGRPPFRGSTAMDTLLQVMEVEPTAPRKLKADIPPDIETVCLKCLEKSPSARYPTARALAEELDRFLKGEPIQARPASLARKAVSWGRRHPGTLSAVAALVMVSLAFGVFYLFEENAFLRAQQVDPGLNRVKGSRHESLEIWGLIGVLGVLAGFFLFFTVQRQARGLSWQQKIELRKLHRGPDLHNRPPQPLEDRTRIYAICGSLVLIGYAVVLLALTIRAYVWEGESIFGQIFPIYTLIYLGLAILGMVARDYRLIHYGSSSRQLNEQQIVQIRRALEDRDLAGALRRYREAVPDADYLEANQYVGSLWQSLRTEFPDKYALPRFSLSTLHWKAMGTCALIEVAFLGVLWLAMMPAYPASVVSQFACSMLFGLGAIASLRTERSWRQLLLLVPAVAVLILSETFVPSLAGGSSHSIWSYLIGFSFGVFLMIAGFTPRRPRLPHP